MYAMSETMVMKEETRKFFRLMHYLYFLEGMSRRGVRFHIPV